MALATVVCVNPTCPEYALGPNPVVHRNDFIFISTGPVEDTGFRNGLSWCDRCLSWGQVVITLSPDYRGTVVDDATQDPYFYRDVEGVNRNNHLLPAPIPFPFEAATPPPPFVPMRRPVDRTERLPFVFSDMIARHRFAGIGELPPHRSARARPIGRAVASPPSPIAPPPALALRGMFWNIRGDFARIYDSGGPLNRNMSFENSAPDAVISKLDLCGYRDGDYMIVATASNPAAHRQLIDQARARGLVPRDLDNLLSQFSVVCHTLVPNGVTLLQVVQAVEPRFEEIREQINTIFGIALPPAGVLVVGGMPIPVAMPAPRPVLPLARPPSPSSIGPQASARLPLAFPPPARIARGAELVIPPMTFPEEDCVICSDNLNNGNPLVRTTCTHFFHNDCLLRWQGTHGDVYSYADPLERRAGTFDVRLNNNLCPMCRRELFPR